MTAAVESTISNECNAVKEANSDNLLNRQGVVGTGVGVKWVDGMPTDQPAILVFVQKKRAERGIISKFTAEDIVPEKLDGFPTDVIEVGNIVKQDFRSRIRPLKPGYSVGHPKISAGTIGGFFLDGDNEPIILSNCHVLANENNAQIGDYIYQPGIADFSGDSNFRGWVDPIKELPYIGTLKRFVKLQSNGNVQDSSIALIHPKIVSENLIDTMFPTINRSLAGFGTPSINMQVQKCGRTTGYTTGRILGLHASFTIDYDFGPAQFNDCVVLTAMSKGGDSGSIIQDMNMNAVALLFAGSPKVTIANPISYVKDEYKLQIWDHSSVHEVLELIDKGWLSVSGGGTITTINNIIKIQSAANNYCYLQHANTKFTSIQVKVNTGTDKGATWGPGIVVQWPNGMIKVNLRYNGSFGGYYNTNENLIIGSVKPNTDYTLRIRRGSNSIVGEVNNGDKWYTVVEVPNSVFSHSPICVRVGKTNELGHSSNHSTTGEVGECSFFDLTIN